MPSEGERGEEVVDVTDGNYRRYASTSGSEFVRKIFTLLPQAKEGVVTLRVTLRRTLSYLGLRSTRVIPHLIGPALISTENHLDATIYFLSITLTSISDSTLPFTKQQQCPYSQNKHSQCPPCPHRLVRLLPLSLHLDEHHSPTPNLAP